MNDNETLLTVRDLRTYFDTDEGLVKAVDGVSFRIPRGRTFALVGESGCGKSVTALSILRLIPDPPGRIVGGRITFDQSELLSLSEKQMRRIRGNDIAMIFQEPMTSLNPVYTIGDQIVEAIELHQDKRGGAAMAHAVEMLRLTGIAEPQLRVREYPHQMSGGMRQRVMIAMALSCEPDLLIADEPTTALDVTIQAQILELMQQLQRRNNMAVMLITHDLAVVAVGIGAGFMTWDTVWAWGKQPGESPHQGSKDLGQPVLSRPDPNVEVGPTQVDVGVEPVEEGVSGRASRLLFEGSSRVSWFVMLGCAVHYVYSFARLSLPAISYQLSAISQGSPWSV